MARGQDELGGSGRCDQVLRQHRGVQEMGGTALLDSPGDAQATVAQTVGEISKRFWPRADSCFWRVEVGQPLP
eukprot:9073309-Pyramimonas_sp.AAC.1